MKTTLPMALAIGSMFVLASTGCEPDQPQGGDPTERRALVVFDSFERSGLIYSTGDFRYPENGAGNKQLWDSFLMILDASDPTHPVVAEIRETKLSRAIGIFKEQLVLLQPGFDEDAIQPVGTPGALPEQNVKVKLYSLADPFAPALAKSITLPSSSARTLAQNFTVLDSDTIMVSSGDASYENPDAIPLTWVIKPAAPAGSEVIATMTQPCNAPIVRGTRLWCFNNSTLPEFRKARGYDLPISGGIATPSHEVTLPQSWIATQGVLLDSGDALVIGPGNATKARRVSFDVAGMPVIQNQDDFEGSEVAVLSLGASKALIQTTRAIHLVDSTTLGASSALSFPGEPYSQHSGGSRIREFGGAGSGMFVASAGDYGVMILKLNGFTLEKVGGYYRMFGTNIGTDDTLQEGNY